MKFRAVIRDPQKMKEFLGIIVTLSKLSKDCVMNISLDKVYFIVNEDSSNAAPFVWVEIASSKYFTDFVMEGARKEHRNMLLLINTSNFSRALSILRTSARHCKMKLTNIQFPCLTIEMEVFSSCSEKTRQVIHDVPIDIIPKIDWSNYKLPKISPKFVLNIPWNRIMRGLIEKMKNLSPSIVFFLTSNGEMNLIAETDLATTTTRLKKLNVIEYEKSDKRLELSCSVDSRKTFLFLSSLQAPNVDIVCGVLDERLIHIKVDVREDVAINTILPAVCV